MKRMREKRKTERKDATTRMTPSTWMSARAETTRTRTR
jgi:hypothetical protein